jgi:cell division protein ZapA
MEQVVTKVLIGGREYPIRVHKSEEQSVLKAVKLINDRLSQYEKTYTGSDKFDHLAMCAIHLATELTALELRGNVFKQEVNQKVEELDHMLTGYLSA